MKSYAEIKNAWIARLVGAVDLDTLKEEIESAMADSKNWEGAADADPIADAMGQVAEDLPHWGPEPENLPYGVWSWDAERPLIGESWSELEFVGRDYFDVD